MSQDDIENECHVEAQYVGLELLCEGYARESSSCVDRDNGIGATWRRNSKHLVYPLSDGVHTNTQAHDHPSNRHDSLPPSVPLMPARNMMTDPRLAVAKYKNIADFLPF